MKEKADPKKPNIEAEKLRLLCRNCNTEWIEERPEGYCVRYEKNNNYLVNIGNPDKKKYFICPKCKSHKKIARLSVKPVIGKLAVKDHRLIKDMSPAREVAKKIAVKNRTSVKEFRSICCNADVTVNREGEARYYVCTNCNNICGISRKGR